MSVGDQQLSVFAAEAERLARLAGEELLRQRRSSVRAESKGRRRELVTAADRAAEQIVVGGLQQASRTTPCSPRRAC